MKTITDRPGRYFAILVFAPVLRIISKRIHEEYPADAQVLRLLSILLFLYESYWILTSDAEHVSTKGR